MYKLLIVDDEPLVQAGIKSMLDWNEMGLEICGAATNGRAALKIIEEQLPDIVVTDIKMPVMDGLELVKVCRERYGNTRPSFIILTSYEDFHVAKEALTYQVSDYLVKLELTPESLRNSIDRVLQQIYETENTKEHSSDIVHPFYDKFFISLLHNLFESEEQFRLQSHDLKLNFDYSAYVCCYGEMLSEQAEALSTQKQFALYTSSLQMTRQLAEKYLPCYSLALDIRHFALIFCYEGNIPERENTYPEEITDILRHVSTSLENYYNVKIHCGIGSLVEIPMAISASYQYSRQACQETSEERPIASYAQCTEDITSHSSFNFSLFSADLTKAFEEYDSETLTKTLDSICELFSSHPQYYVQALDAASNILYLSISLLQDGESVVSDFFKDSPDSYRSLYHQSSVEQIVNWLKFFSEKMSELFESRRKEYKNHIVTNVKKYIGRHLSERLTLNEVAAVFGISPNYLSQLFGKYNETGFSEYINHCKIAESKKLLEDGSLKVYEVADMLGFESAFYFSKVFKKVEGVSPTEYLNAKCV